MRLTNRLSTTLNTPARVVIAVGFVILVTELLIMVLINNFHAAIAKDLFQEDLLFEFLDPILLTAIVSPALYLLIFRPLNRQSELELQFDELRRFQKMTIGRELHMKELVEEIAALRKKSSRELPVKAQFASGSSEDMRQTAAQLASTQMTEESQRSALLFMLEDLENARRQIEHAHQEWMVALDVVKDPIFLHDEQFQILRCNKAYQQRAGIPMQELIGQPYYDVFPKSHEPLSSCLRMMKEEDGEKEEEVLASDAIYRSRAFSIHNDEGAYLHSVHILEDITERKAAEEQIQHYVTQLKNAFMRVVEVATTLTEMRDPYTAGHERRVAELAVAIGIELGLDERQLEGLRVAGLLHDIGKIRLPAEILAKPGRITTAEYSLIKEHPLSGYEVLKDVGFPWPVADVAWQHHERMDGSGYPRGLKGNEILLEARIMSVADVVEAMASHRPYRPGHGVDKALVEIETGSGTTFDATVVEACLQLFRKKGYELPS